MTTSSLTVPPLSQRTSVHTRYELHLIWAKACTNILLFYCLKFDRIVVGTILNVFGISIIKIVHQENFFYYLEDTFFAFFIYIQNTVKDHTKNLPFVAVLPKLVAYQYLFWLTDIKDNLFCLIVLWSLV